MSDPRPLHPEAEKAFDARAAGLLQMLEKGAAPPPAESKLVGSMAHVPIRHRLKEGDLLEPIRIVEGRDPATRELVELTIRHDGCVYGLAREATARLRKLARDVASRPELRDTCDLKFVQDSLIRWLDATGVARSSSRGWVNALSDDLRAAVQETAFRVPLVGIAVEQGFKLGPWSVTYFSRQDTDRLVARLPQEVQQAMRQKYERDLQGKVCVDGVARAVPSRAQTLAIEAAEAVVLALRFVHHASVDIATRCGIDLYGRTTTPVLHMILTSGPWVSVSSGIDGSRGAEDAFFSAQQLPQLEAAGLGAASAFLSSNSPTELQEAAWVALDIFVHGVASHLWRERLIGALVAAESLLLANSTEPIQKSLGQRMAWLLGKSLEERKQLVQDLKDGYEARSAFVHHGQEIEDSKGEVLNRVLIACRAVVHTCLMAENFRTRQELIRHLDDLLMT